MNVDATSTPAPMYWERHVLDPMVHVERRDKCPSTNVLETTCPVPHGTRREKRKELKKEERREGGDQHRGSAHTVFD